MKIHLSKILLIIMLLNAVITKQILAQDYLPCGIYLAEQQLKLRNPNIEIDRNKLEAFTNEYIQKFPHQTTTNGTILYTIPVVFHIMHNYGGENISKSQVLDAVRIMNEDFQKLNADTFDVAGVFKPLVADCQIEFKLAQLDPNGNCTDGITRTVTPLTGNADDNVKYLIAWPNNMYLNIWVVRNISFGAAGFAYYPGIGSPEDGIVILHNYTGSIGTSPGSNYNRHSLSHEIGHYLNLRHTWGNSNSPGDPANCNDDDLVFDTPNTIGVSNFSCDTTQHTCGASMPDNVQNYMDYAACHNMFTPGQKTRMHAALNSATSGRSNLWSVANLAATGTNAGFTPTACNMIPDFPGAGKGICEGATITYKDLSWNINSTYTRLWSFPGGTPSTSIDSMTVITYNTAGVYDATLSIINTAGTFTLNRPQYVTVTPASGTGIVPYSEGFETITLPGAANWTIENDGGPAWQVTTTAASTGSKSIKVLNDGTNPVDMHDVFITEGMNLSNITSPTFSFKLAFATKANSADQLKVFASNNCGQTWVMRYNKTSTVLATAGNVNGNFIPTANQWRTESFPIGAYQGSASVRFKFEFTNQGGNHIYIDDININGTVGIQEINAAALQLNLQPNPAQTQTTLSYTLDKNENVKIELYDLVGKRMQQIENSKQTAGEHHINIHKPNAGMFLLKMTAGDKQVIQKVVFE
ncbi:MAG: M43 family zinc metalloprotease [Bacteroidia bacterium]